MPEPPILQETLAAYAQCDCEHGGTRCSSILAGERGPLCGPCGEPHNGRHSSTAVPVAPSPVVQAHGLAHCILAVAAWLEQQGDAEGAAWLTAQWARQQTPAACLVCQHPPSYHGARGCDGLVQDPTTYAGRRCGCGGADGAL